jgi:general secretion pathway protein G
MADIGNGVAPDDESPVNAIEQQIGDCPRFLLGGTAVRPYGKRGLSPFGFTLIEVLVVVAILAILAAIVVPRIMDRPDEAKRVAAKADIGAIVQSLKLYRLDNGFYPSTDQGLAALVQRPTTPPVPNNWKQGGYLERLPRDPWGGDYQYLSPGVHGEIDVFSLGADRTPGGEGSGADIGNWE